MKLKAARANRLALERPSTPNPLKKGAHDFDGEARLNVTLPIDLHTRVKVRASERRQTIRQYILSLLATDGIK